MLKLKAKKRPVPFLTIVSIAVIAFGFLYMTWQMGRSYGNSEIACTVEIIEPAIPMPMPLPGTVLDASN